MFRCVIVIGLFAPKHCSRNVKELIVVANHSVIATIITRVIVVVTIVMVIDSSIIIWHFSVQLLRGFVVSANLRNTFWPFYQEENGSLRDSLQSLCKRLRGQT